MSSLPKNILIGTIVVGLVWISCKFISNEVDKSRKHEIFLNRLFYGRLLMLLGWLLAILTIASVCFSVSYEAYNIAIKLIGGLSTSNILCNVGSNLIKSNIVEKR